MLHLPHNVDPPVLHVLRLIAKALERNPDFHLVAGRSRATLRLEDEVRAEIGLFARLLAASERAAAAAARALVQRAISLDTERVDREHHRLTTVVERAEQDLNVVVAEDLVAIEQVRVHQPVCLVRADTEMDGGGRVPYQHARGIGGRAAIDRLKL